MSAAGNPALTKQGIPVYTEVYRQAFGTMPAGEKFEALLLMNDIATKLQRGFFLPKGAPDEAAADLRRAYQVLATDPDFVADYERITKEKPDFVGAEDVQLVFDKMRAVRPEIRQVLKVLDRRMRRRPRRMLRLRRLRRPETLDIYA